MEAPYVLLVEKDPDALATLRGWLEEAGCRVVCAEDGVKALRVLRHEPAPFVVLLELLLPGLDGWELRQHQLAEPHLAGIPVLVTTMVTAEYRRRNELQAAGYLETPITREALLAAVAPFRPAAG